LMAIGQGQGEGKTQQALEQALHHPLMDTVSLMNAKGVIANFTGGNDLALFDVQTALTNLQQQTGSQTEIVFGVINDERMDGRVQVILMVTGLGSTTLEEAMGGMKYDAQRIAARPSLTASAQREEVALQPAAPARYEAELPPFFRNRYREK